MISLKAWPNLKFLGTLRDVEMNVFSDKLDHGINFSRIIAKKLYDLNVPSTRVKRITKQLGNNGLVVTDYYELIFDSDEDMTVANIILAGELGYKSKKGW